MSEIFEFEKEVKMEIKADSREEAVEKFEKKIGSHMKGWDVVNVEIPDFQEVDA